MSSPFDPDGKNETIVATGLRNCSGIAIQPATCRPWCVVNERDGLGDDTPFEYATQVKEGAFYGWPPQGRAPGPGPPPLFGASAGAAAFTDRLLLLIAVKDGPSSRANLDAAESVDPSRKRSGR